MNSLKKILAALLVGCMIIGCAACSPSSKKKLELPERGDDSEIELEWFVNTSYWSWPGGNYGFDYLSDLIKRRTGVTIHFRVPAGGGNTEILTMISTGDLPDIITCGDDIRGKLYDGNFLWSYDDMIEKYSPSFKDIIKQIDDIYDWYRESDGKTYGLPNYASSNNYLNKDDNGLNPQQAAVIRTDLYDQIGRPDISTPDKLLDALERIKNEIGTYNGSKLIPLQIYEFTQDGNPSINNTLRQYFSVPFEDKNGKHLRHSETEFQVYRFLNEAYNRGLLTIDNFSDTREQINEKVAAGRVVCLFSALQDFTPYITTLYDNDNSARYEAFAMKNYDGVDPHLADTAGYGYQTTSITTNAKRPDRCLDLIQYLMSDQGQIEMLFGAADETGYTIDANGYVQFDPNGNYYKAYTTMDEKMMKYYTLGFNLLTDYMRTKDYYAPATDARSIATQEFYIKQPLQQYTYNGKLGTLKSDPIKEEKIGYSKITNKINVYWEAQTPKIIMASNVEEARKLYDEGLAREKELGGDTVDEYQDECFQRAKQLYGVEFAWPENQK